MLLKISICTCVLAAFRPCLCLPSPTPVLTTIN